MNRIITIFSWAVVLWICKVFLSSLPYKFSGHPDTVHIFSTIGSWMQVSISEPLGRIFTSYGAYGVGIAELLVSLLLLLPALVLVLNKLNFTNVQVNRANIHALGGLLASVVMCGAVFFHLATPLGIEVLHNGVSDNGSLFYAAVSILILGLIMAIANLKLYRKDAE